MDNSQKRNISQPLQHELKRGDTLSISDLGSEVTIQITSINDKGELSKIGVFFSHSVLPQLYADIGILMKRHNNEKSQHSPWT